MNLHDQGASSGPSAQPTKRRRGRPRKDQSLKPPEAAHASLSVGVKEYHHQKIDRKKGIECKVGQSVTGVVEAAFESGYLLTVRIGNINFRGVVFKPGHCAPITSENDIAPHVHMIKRRDVRFTGENVGLYPGQETVAQMTSVVPSKCKYEPPEIVVNPGGLQVSNHGDLDVEMAEPLSVVLPDQSVPVGQIFVSAEPHSSNEVGPGRQHDGDGSSKGTTAVVEEEKDIERGSSQPLDCTIKDGMKGLKPSTDESSIVSKKENRGMYGLPTESLCPGSFPEPSFDCEHGVMTRLLKVLEKNADDRRAQIAEVSTFTTQVELEGTTTTEADGKNKNSLA